MSAVASKLARLDDPSFSLTKKKSDDRCRVDIFHGGGVVSVETDDFAHFARYTRGWSIDLQSCECGPSRIKCFGICTSSVQLAFTEHVPGYCCQGDVPKDTVTLWAPIDPSRVVFHHGHSVDSSDVIVTRSGRGFEVVNRLGSPLLTVAISEALLDRNAAVLWDEPHQVGRTADRLHFSSMIARRAFVDLCQGFLHDLRRRPDLLANPQCASLMEEKLLEKLLLGGAPEPRYTSPPYRHHVARRAYQYMQERIGESLSIRDLCSVTRASYGTLEKGFRETYGMSPLAYLRVLRLLRARTALRQPNQETTVTGVAIQFGFLELGRFSVQYHERFGETPSETLHKTRAANPCFSLKASAGVIPRAGRMELLLATSSFRGPSRKPALSGV